MKKSSQIHGPFSFRHDLNSMTIRNMPNEIKIFCTKWKRYGIFIMKKLQEVKHIENKIGKIGYREWLFYVWSWRKCAWKLNFYQFLIIIFFFLVWLNTKIYIFRPLWVLSIFFYEIRKKIDIHTYSGLKWLKWWECCWKLTSFCSI